eukprot:Skav234693  [mRNA]  locus=scaffold3643:167957:169555:- [translate_table: standard]
MELVQGIQQAALEPSLPSKNVGADERNEKPKHKLKPDVIMYNSMIAACQHCSDAAWALRLFQEMPNKKLKPNTSSYNALLAAFESATLWEDCLSLLLQMQHQTPCLVIAA